MTPVLSDGVWIIRNAKGWPLPRARADDPEIDVMEFQSREAACQWLARWKAKVRS